MEASACKLWSGCSVLPWWLHHMKWESVDCHVGILYSIVVQAFTHYTLQGYSTDAGLTRLLPRFWCCLQGQRFASHQWSTWQWSCWLFCWAIRFLDDGLSRQKLKRSRCCFTTEVSSYWAIGPNLPKNSCDYTVGMSCMSAYHAQQAYNAQKIWEKRWSQSTQPCVSCWYWLWHQVQLHNMTYQLNCYMNVLWLYIGQAAQHAADHETKHEAAVETCFNMPTCQISTA